MANPVLRDALDITKAEIIINWVVRWDLTWLTINIKSPEDLVPVFWGLVRRRKAETNEWSADYVFLYADLVDMLILKGWAKFNVEVSMVNPNNTAETQKLLLSDCTANSIDLTMQESSTYKMSWTFANLRQV